MKKLFVLFLFAFPILAKAGGPGVLAAIVPQVVQGTTVSTNNTRVPFWFWGEINGLTPNATYHYFVAIDTVNSSLTSNGAGLPYLINPITRTIRRILNPSMTANTGFDSLVADNTGTIRGWFGVEPTANGRFTPGFTVYPKIMLNNGAGGTAVVTRLLFQSFPVTVIGFGTTSMSATQGSALYDSLNAATKNFICVYDNVNATGRPVEIAIVENDSLYLKQLPSTAPFYKNKVDSLDFHWGTIIPNNLPNGVRALEERMFGTGTPVDTVTDADGIWCYGTNTINMSNGGVGMYLNSTFVLNGSAMFPDTTWTGFNTTFTANSNSPNSTYTWNFGDLGTGTGSVVTHTYLTPGIMNAFVIISTGGCSDTIYHTVVVELSTGVITPLPLSFLITPNPTDGELFISTKDNNEKIINVVNVLGEIISSQALTGNKISIDLSNQTPGVYFVEVTDKITGKSGVKKIVLQ
jgi:hypothetical protein